MYSEFPGKSQGKPPTFHCHTIITWSNEGLAMALSLLAYHNNDHAPIPLW
jgi:hypothetical protein